MSDLLELRALIRALPFSVEPEAEGFESGHGDGLTLCLVRACITMSCSELAEDQRLVNASQWASKNIKSFKALEDPTLRSSYVVNLATMLLRKFTGSDSSALEGFAHSIKDHDYGDALEQAYFYDVTFNRIGNAGGSSVIDALSKRLWPQAAIEDALYPEGSIENYVNSALYTFFNGHDDVWSFWRSWYRGFLTGIPLDWSLQRRIALEITDEEWTEGSAIVARRIKEIEEDFDRKTDDSRGYQLPGHEGSDGASYVEAEKLEPGLIDRIVSQPEAVRVSMSALSETVSLRLDLFHRIARPNEQIPFIETLCSLPNTASSINELAIAARTDDSTKAKLEEEIGKLRAEVELLRTQLKDALFEIEELKKKPWFKKASLLVTASTIGAVVSGLWVLSGDDKRLSERWSNLATDLEFIRENIWPDGEVIPVEELQYELPESFDA